MDAPHGRLRSGWRGGWTEITQECWGAVLNKSWRQHPTRLQLYGHPHHENYTSSTNQTRRTLLEKQGRAHKRCTPVDPHIWMCKSGTSSTNIHTSNYVRTQDVTLKTYRRRWMIGRNGERGSGISALAARHDDDDDKWAKHGFVSTESKGQFWEWKTLILR